MQHCWAVGLLPPRSLVKQSMGVSQGLMAQHANITHTASDDDHPDVRLVLFCSSGAHSVLHADPAMHVVYALTFVLVLRSFLSGLLGT